MIYYPFNPTSHYNKFGYYRIGQELTYSKWEALQISSTMKMPIEWIFNDDVYANFDWSNEPHMSLTDLYRIRAQQIRDRYDYVVIMYSGGADSHNVLMSFLDNDIHVDEVAHMIELNGDRDPNSFANAEVTKVAWPVAENLIKEKSPDTVHRLIDITDVILDLHNLIDAEEYLTATSSWMTPANLSRSFLRERIKEYSDLIASGKKVCFVWGADKPNLAVLHDPVSSDTKYAVTFSDRESCLVSPRQKYLSRSWEHDEFFYWTPELPELVCKQAHVLRKLVTMTADSVMPGHFVLQEKKYFFKEFGWSVQNNKLCVLAQDLGHSAIYPHWNADTFSSGKTRSRVFSDRDMWLFKDMQATDTGRMFLSVLDRASQNTFWRGSDQGFACSFSQLYPLDTNLDLSKYRVFMPHDSNF